MTTPVTQEPPFAVGERIAPTQLVGWNYAGLSGLPDKAGSYRRYIKGLWVLELTALSNKGRPAKVLAVRSQAEDQQWWRERTARS